MSKTLLVSPNKRHQVTIDKGELISYIFDDSEIMHQKGNPGWRNVDTEMFPLIGATSPNAFIVSTPRGVCKQDQHGLLRELEYSAKNYTVNSVSFDKSYVKNTKVKNTKFPEKSTESLVSWPYNFEFTKFFELTNNGLVVKFEIKAEKGMPYMLGYHPAFMLNGNKKEIIKTPLKEISLDKIIGVGDSAFPILNTTRLTLITEKGPNINIETKGFENYMLWTPASNMLCIEPVTYYPNATKDCLTPGMFRSAKDLDVFEVYIRPS
jgi:hypothetical protein